MHKVVLVFSLKICIPSSLAEVVEVVMKTEDTPPQQPENEKSVDAPKKEKVRRSTRISKKRALLKVKT